MWKKGRVNKKGDLEGEELTKTVQKIVRKLVLHKNQQHYLTGNFLMCTTG